jgi:hypothetical protein
MADGDDKKTPSELLLNEAMQKAGVKADEQGHIRVQDAIRLKHSINQDIRHCGLNAQQIEEKKKITREDWAAVRKWYAELVKMYGYRLRLYWYIVAAALGVFYLTYTVQPWHLYAGIALALVIMWMAAKLGQADGYREGFFAGYENGFEGAINKMLGIDEKESRNIHDRAVEMEIDEGVIASLDKQQDTKAQD